MHPDIYLAQQGRRRKTILGDGNCFFRAVSFVVHGSEDKHGEVRQNIMAFVAHNQERFQQYVMQGNIEEHIITMRREGAWATQVETYGAASFYQIPLYICSPHPATKQYRWLAITPLDRAHLQFEDSSRPQMQSNITHVELCHTYGDHFDCVLGDKTLFPTSPPQLYHTSSSINIT